MNKLNELELTNINGGGVSATIFGCIGLAIVFLVSAVYGYIHPNKCEG